MPPKPLAKDLARKKAEKDKAAFQPPPGLPQLTPIDLPVAYAFQNVDDEPYMPPPGQTQGGMGGAYFTNDVPVAGAGELSFRGMQGNASFQPENWVDPALIVAGGAGPFLVNRVAAAKGARLGSAVADDLFEVATRGFGKASQGGRVFSTYTPFGKTLGSTRIQSQAATQANMGNLSKWYDSLATRAGSTAAELVGDQVRKRAMQMYVGALGAKLYGPDGEAYAP